jgi:predicted MFS family arabinose efflux permease
MERNLALYPAYQAARNLMFWQPIFFLYFASFLPLSQVLVLEAVYYAAVVVFEVPSGYLSDRWGRRPMLVTAMIATTAAYLLFAWTSAWETFVVAQVLLAAGMAFNSGTDSALLYDSLAQSGKAHEFGAREGRAQGWGFAAMALAASADGVLAGIDLRVAYVGSAAGAVVALGLALGFEEPHIEDAAASPLRQLGHVLRQLGTPTLTWLFALAVSAFVFNHVPYEFFQPYLGFLLAGHTESFAWTPLAAGATQATAMLLSVFASRRAADAGRVLGPAPVLLGAMVLQGLVIAGMALVIHPAIVVLIVFRSVPGALIGPVLGSVIHPRLPAGIRATYLSVQSLAARLAFAGALALASYAVGDIETLTPASMSDVLWMALVGLACVLVILALTMRAVMRAATRDGDDGA